MISQEAIEKGNESFGDMGRGENLEKSKEFPIILMQFTETESSRTYSYFQTRNEALKFVFNLYEDSFSKSGVKLIEMTDLLSFIYSFYDFAYLELDVNTKVYKPYGKDWFAQILINSISILS